MPLSERLAAIESKAQLPDPAKPKNHPTGWEPGLVWSPSNGGTLTVGPLPNEPDQAVWDMLMTDWGIDPATTEVVDGTLEIRAWDANLGDGNVHRMKYYKVKVRPRVAAVDRVDLEALYKEIRKVKPPKRVKTGDSTLLVALSDFQIGNGDFGGVAAQAEALADLVDAIPQRLADLRRQGHQIGTLCVAGMGDLIENTCGFYAAQPHRTEIDLREQMKMVRRAIRDMLVAAAPHAESVKVVAVPGNHGETRQNGKQITRVGDNHDVAVFEQVAEILAMNPDAFGHIDWRLALDEMVISVELSGKIVSFTHGHAARGGGDAAKTMWKYWSDHAMGRRYPAFADSDILISGHFHHLNVKEQEGRLLIVCPSLTKVSEYWADYKGETTAPGTVSVVISPDGWGELALL